MECAFVVFVVVFFPLCSLEEVIKSTVPKVCLRIQKKIRLDPQSVRLYTCHDAGKVFQ